MELELVAGDITGDIAASVDAIVNAANSKLLGGGGVDGAIHRAGGKAILRECKELRRTTWPGGLPPGSAVATTAGNLPCRWVIHTVGPVFNRKDDRSATLRSCYTSSLTLADEIGAKTIAFPLISAGLYRWPKDDAIAQARTAITTAAGAVSVERILLVLFDHDTYALAKRLLQVG